MVDRRPQGRPSRARSRVSPNSRIIHSVNELHGNLGVCSTTDATNPVDNEEDHRLRELFKSANHQRVPTLSSDAASIIYANNPHYVNLNPPFFSTTAPT